MKREIQFRDVAGNEWDITQYTDKIGPGYGLATMWQGTAPIISVHFDGPPQVRTPKPVRRIELNLGRSTVISITQESAKRICNFFQIAEAR